MNATSLLPAASVPTGSMAITNVGFKDWALICAALGAGRQSLILRKGGIAEGRDGFRFKHEAFFLFPTQYHQQAKHVRSDAAMMLEPVVAPPEGTVEIRYFFVLEGAVWIGDRSMLARLEPFHVWREDVVRERFEYGDQRGLQCAFGRGIPVGTRLELRRPALLRRLPLLDHFARISRCKIFIHAGAERCAA